MTSRSSFRVMIQIAQTYAAKKHIQSRLQYESTHCDPVADSHEPRDDIILDDFEGQVLVEDALLLLVHVNRCRAHIQLFTWS
jgi:hypothetical protein